MVRALALAMTLALGGCSTPQVRYVTAPLPLPPRPELPTLTGNQLQCLSDEAYKAIVRRDRLRREYAEQLEAVIRSTHAEGTDGL